MPDASAGVFTGLYWVATGRTPMADLDDEDEDLKGKPEDEELDISLKDRKP